VDPAKPETGWCDLIQLEEIPNPTTSPLPRQGYSSFKKEEKLEHPNFPSFGKGAERNEIA